MTNKTVAKFITVAEFAEEYQKDISYIGKLIREHKIPVVEATKNGRACNALDSKSRATLEGLLAPVLSEMGEGEIEVLQLAEERGQDVSGLLKMLKKNNFKLEKRLRVGPGGNRAVNVLTKSEYARFQKEHPVRIKL